jgi:hypothetical protein
MTEAKSLNEIYNNFEGQKPLLADEYEFFVNIYEKKLKRFIGNIQRNDNYENIFFIAGQRGNGKSTILNNLKHRNADFEKKYHIKHLQAKNLLDYDDISIVDILLIVGFYLLDDSNLKSSIKTDLDKTFKEELEVLANLNSGELIKEDNNIQDSKKEVKINNKISVGAKFLSFFNTSTSFSATYKIDENIRKEAKKIYKFKIKDLLKIINNLILKYIKLLNDNKKLLIIIDGLEKLNNIDTLFIKDINILQDINCFKIITMPVYLKEEVDINNVKAIDFTMEVDNNGKIKDLKLLRDVVLKRIDNKFKFTLITEKALDLIIVNSAGNLRQLLDIVQISSSEAMDIFEMDTIDIKVVQSALEIIKGTLATRTQSNSKFLSYIQKHHKITDKTYKEELKQALHDGTVFAYFNGQVYYDINPVIKDNIIS